MNTIILYNINEIHYLIKSEKVSKEIYVVEVFLFFKLM